MSVFTATTFLGSFLLFMIQPMIARMALPRLGGTPAVWNSAMLCFQLLLLGGYAYAHWLTGRRKKTQILVHKALFVVAAFWLPLALVEGNPPVDDMLLLWVPGLIFTSIGLPFVLLAAQAPMLQHWYKAYSGQEPYRLYAVSSLGSFAGLLGYPLFWDPFFSTNHQSIIWSWGFGLFALLMLVCAVMSLQRRADWVSKEPISEPTITSSIGWRRLLSWMAIAAIPSGLILSTTTHLTTDIMSMPMLWVAPLGLYLLSFSLAFAPRSRFVDWLAPHAPITIFALAILALATDRFEIYVTGSATLLLLFVASLVLHRRLYLDRPDVSKLTQFYFMLSLGGAIGGAFVAVVAPLIFDWSYEFPLLALAAIALTQSTTLRTIRPWHWFVGLCITAVVIALAKDWIDANSIVVALMVVALVWLIRHHRWLMLLCASASLVGLAGVDPLILSWNGLRHRSYFGIYTIRENEIGTLRTLAHGTTVHGAQQLEQAKLLQPTTYFGHDSGAGQILTAAPVLYGNKARIAVLGMGVGTLACYARPGQNWSFFEIDPLVVDLAVKKGWFTYMTNCAPDAVVHIGDARLKLAEQPSAFLDILVMDVFSSDSVPTHLLTKQAFDIYDWVLAPGGVLLVHISNRYIDFEPVLASEAKARGWASALVKHNPSQVGIDSGEIASAWVLMSRSEVELQRTLEASQLEQTGSASHWRSLRSGNEFVRLTDDYGSVLKLVRLSN